MTVFAQRVLHAVDRIPRGRVMSYGDVPEFVGMGSSRAAGVVLSGHGGEVLLASVDGNTGRHCGGFGYEVPQCIANVAPNSRQRLPLPPVGVRQDENGTVVAVGDAGLYFPKSGGIGPEFSTQSWQCIGGDG